MHILYLEVVVRNARGAEQLLSVGIHIAFIGTQDAGEPVMPKKADIHRREGMVSVARRIFRLTTSGYTIGQLPTPALVLIDNPLKIGKRKLPVA